MRHTQNVQFFKKISSEDNFLEIHRECCKSMTMEEYSAEDLIFNFGEKGEKFYIILTGSVSVKMPAIRTFTVNQVTINKIEELLFAQPDSPDLLNESKIEPVRKTRVTLNLTSNVAKILRSLTMNKGLHEVALKEEERKLYNLLKQKTQAEQRSFIRNVRESGSDSFEAEIRDLSEIGILYAGSAFGELALISDKPRSASIQARERSSFLVLTKNDFKKILGVISENKLSLIVKFLQKIQYFQGWSKSSLTKIAYYLESLKFKKNQSIYRENEPVEGIYFIKDGEVIIEKKQVLKSETPSVFSSSPKNFIPKVLKKPKLINEFKIVIKSKYEAFGGFEVCERQNLRMFSAICNSAACEVLFMKKEAFLARVPNIENIRNMVNEDHRRIVDMFDDLVDKEDIQKDLRNFTPTGTEKIEFAGMSTNWKVKNSSTCKRILPSLNKSAQSRYLRKLTKQEIDDAVNGRSSAMRKYGSKCNIVNSSFNGSKRRQMLADLMDLAKVKY